MKKIRLWLDNLYTLLCAIYNPLQVVDIVMQIQRDNKPRIRAYSVDYLIWIDADKDYR